MNLKNTPHLDYIITLISWVVSIMAFNPLWMLIPYTLIGILIFIWLLQIRNKNKLKHSEDLVLNFQNPEVRFNQVKGSLALEVILDSDEINEHLRDAYIDINKMIERRNIYIKLYNQELKEFYSDLQENILRCIEKKFIKYDYSRSGVGQINFFNTESIESDILGIIRRNCQSPELSFRINPHDRFYDLVCTYNQNIWIISDNIDELKKTEKNIINTFNNTIKTKLKFKLLLCYYDKIRVQTSINKELNQIIDSIRNRATPLKGKCSKCLKENIFGEINGT